MSSLANCWRVPSQINCRPFMYLCIYLCRPFMSMSCLCYVMLCLADPVTNPYGGIGEMYIQAWQGEYKNLIHVPCGGDSESVPYRSEERRVGKESRSRWSP